MLRVLGLFLLCGACATGGRSLLRPGGVPLLSVTWEADALGRVDGTFEDCGGAVGEAGAAWAAGHGMRDERTASSAALGVRAGVFKASSEAEDGVFELRHSYAWDRRTVEVTLEFLASGGGGDTRGRSEQLRSRYEVDGLSADVRRALRCDDPSMAR